MGRGGWHPGTCLFILYSFNVVVTKINSLKVQNLENMHKTKEEINGNPCPTSSFDVSFQSFFYVCMCVCSLSKWGHGIHAAWGIHFFFIPRSRVRTLPCPNTVFFAILLPYLFETSLLSKVCGPWTVVAGCAQITGSRPLWVSVWLGSVTGDEGTAPRLSVCSQAPVPPRPDSWGRLKLVTHPSGPQFLHL